MLFSVAAAVELGNSFFPLVYAKCYQNSENHKVLSDLITKQHKQTFLLKDTQGWAAQQWGCERWPEGYCLVYARVCVCVCACALGDQWLFSGHVLGPGHWGVTVAQWLLDNL